LERVGRRGDGGVKLDADEQAADAVGHLLLEFNKSGQARIRILEIALVDYAGLGRSSKRQKWQDKAALG
jgi:hypothetical protein